jgi:hypothetical protein
MKKYALLVVDAMDNDFDKSIAGYDEVHQRAMDYSYSDTLDTLLYLMVSGINSGEYSDNNWYYITDESTKTILYS